MRYLAQNHRTCQCGSRWGRCPECGRRYAHGSESNCLNPECIKMNTPIDCIKCKRIVSENLDGVLDFDMNLIPWRK